MNITQTFRRKNHYHKPILVFKELYRDYYKQSSPFKYRNPHVTTSAENFNFKTISHQNTFMNKQSRPVSKLQKTRSAQQFSQYLLKYGNTTSQFSIQTLDESKNMKTLSSTKNKTFLTKSLDKNRFQQNDDAKRSYFKDNYTQSHPFFQKNKNFMKQKRVDLKQNQTLPILPDVFKQSDESMKKPIQKRIQMQQLKNKFIDRKQKAVEKFSKIRYNFLVKKNYRQEQQESRSLNINPHLKNSFQITKQNIFPQSVL